jgi:hypothetical protein
MLLEERNKQLEDRYKRLDDQKYMLKYQNNMLECQKQEHIRGLVNIFKIVTKQRTENLQRAGEQYKNKFEELDKSWKDQHTRI